MKGRGLAVLAALSVAWAGKAEGIRTVRMGEHAFRCRMAPDVAATGERCEVLVHGKVVTVLDTSARFVFDHGYPFRQRMGKTVRIALFRDMWNGCGMRLYLDYRKGKLVGTDSMPWFPKDPMEGVR